MESELLILKYFLYYSKNIMEYNYKKTKIILFIISYICKFYLNNKTKIKGQDKIMFNSYDLSYGYTEYILDKECEKIYKLIEDIFISKESEKKNILRIGIKKEKKFKYDKKINIKKLIKQKIVFR